MLKKIFNRNNQFVYSYGITSLLLCLFCLNLHAQTNTFPSLGNAGIGTVSPGAGLEIFKSYDLNQMKALRLSYNGSWGSGPFATAFRFIDVESSEGGKILQVNGYGMGLGYNPPAYASTDKLYVNGSVGIGTTSTSGRKLNVMGVISGGVNDYSYNSAVAQLTLESKVDGISGASPTGAFRWYTNPNNSFYQGFLYQLRAFDTVSGESGSLLTINGAGNVGIGTGSTSGRKLNVMGVISGGVNDYSYNAPVAQLTLESKVDGISATSPTGAFRWYTNPNNSYVDGFLYQLRAFDTLSGESGNLLTITGAGNLGIGIANTQGYKLAVAGGMIAESVKVKPQVAWPDYVFSNNYPLPSLQILEKHIKDEGRLPGIPSASEVKANGIDLGEMNVKLLKKIEELTLYLIEKDKQLQKVRIQAQRQEVRLKLIEKHLAKKIDKATAIVHN